MPCELQGVSRVPEGKRRNQKEQKEGCNQSFYHIPSELSQLSVDNSNIM